MHGDGSWDPVPVAISLRVFAKCLEEFARISKGRTFPVELENNPVTDEERGVFLARIAELNNNQLEPDFWGVLLE